MQAMSLVVTDGDGEQNEMRMLQDKLASTMKVVTTLTTQLTELKEQVTCCSCSALLLSEQCEIKTSSFQLYQISVLF